MRSQTRLMVAGLLVSLAGSLDAQSTGMPSFNAPYRAFQRSEFGGVVSFPDAGGTGFEGVYRYAHRRFDIGLRAGLYDPGAGNSALMVGGEIRERVITHNLDFPLDGALVAGAGARFVSGSSGLFVPVGISLGRRVDPKGSSISIVPYVQPTATFVAGGGSSDLLFTLGLGADFRLSSVFDARFSAGIGDLDGVSLGAVWVH